MSQEMQEDTTPSTENTGTTEAPSKENAQVAEVSYELDEATLEAIGRYLEFINHPSRHGDKPLELLHKNIVSTQNAVLARCCSNGFQAPEAPYSFLEQKYRAKQAVREQDSHGRTAFHFLALTGQFEKIGELLEEIRRTAPDMQVNALLNQADHDGLTPLHYLMFSDKRKGQLRHFINGHKLDLLATNKWNEQADEIAIKQDNVLATEAITELKINSRVDQEIKDVFLKAAREGSLKVLRHYISQSNQSLLLINARDDQPHLDQGEIKGQTPLHLAVKYGHFDAAELLIQNGANVQACDDQGNSPLHSACVEQPKLAAAIKKAAAQKDASKPDPNLAQDDKGKREEEDTHHPELRAFYEEHGLNMIQLLLKNGADFLQRNRANKTPQMLCTTTPARVLLQWKESRRRQEAPDYTNSDIYDYSLFETLKWQNTFAETGAVATILEVDSAISGAKMDPDDAQRKRAWDMALNALKALFNLLNEVYLNGQGGYFGGLRALSNSHKELATALTKELSMLIKNADNLTANPSSLIESPEQGNPSDTQNRSSGMERAQLLHAFSVNPHETLYERLTGKRVVCAEDHVHKTITTRLGAMKATKLKMLSSGHDTNDRLMALYSHSKRMLRKCCDAEAELKAIRSDRGIETPLYGPKGRA